MNKKGITIAAALLITMMRDHGAQAAPAELIRELGKITMLSGGKPAGVVTGPADSPFCGGFWWVAAIATLAAIFAALVMAFTAVHRFAPPRPAPSASDERRVEPEQFRQERLEKLHRAGIGG